MARLVLPLSVALFLQIKQLNNLFMLKVVACCDPFKFKINEWVYPMEFQETDASKEDEEKHRLQSIL